MNSHRNCLGWLELGESEVAEVTAAVHLVQWAGHHTGIISTPHSNLDRQVLSALFDT